MDSQHRVRLSAHNSLPRSTLLISLFLFTLMAFSVPAAHGAGNVRYAIPTDGLTSGDCDSWGNACDLQYVLNSAAVSGDQIWVAAGIYKPGSLDTDTFQLKNGVAIYGGFGGWEGSLTQRNWMDHPTTLSGNLGAAHSLHVVTADGTDSTTILDGFTITGGEAGVSVGGGILILSQGSLTIANCIITGNNSADGGGLYQSGETGRVAVTDSTVQLNTASGNGGGLWVQGNLALTNTQVLSNTAGGYGGGLTTWEGRTDLNGGSFINNRALTSNGGAVNVNNGIAITATQFISNTSSDLGGALTQWNAGKPVTISGARFERNAAKTKGGGAYISSTVTIDNSTFVTNTVDSGGSSNVSGGGVYGGNTVLVSASTFSGNVATTTVPHTSFGGGLFASRPITIQDSLFDGNAAWYGGGADGDYTTISVTRSTFQNCPFPKCGYGGGLYAATIHASDSAFLNNVAINSGGALRAYDVVLSSVRVIGNRINSSEGGGGVWARHLDAVNALFVDNKANASNGEAIYGFSIGSALTSLALRHVTIASTLPSSYPPITLGQGALAITDTIVSNYAWAIRQSGATVTGDYDLITTSTPVQSTGGTVTLGSHNLIGADPKFVSAAAGDFHLDVGSPAVDAGMDVGATVDLEGTTRAQGGGYDIGAYEFVRRSQTITFGALPNRRSTDPPFTLAANASSNLAVTFTASGSCSVSGSTVTLKGGGACTITAHQAGNAYYSAAPDVARSFNVTGYLFLPLIRR